MCPTCHKSKPSFTFENYIGHQISLLHLSHVSCILGMLDSLFYEMPPCGAIFDHKLPTFYVNGCRLHIPLANIFAAKEWAASFTCTFFKLAVERSFGILPFPILHMCPSHLRRLWLSRACMLEHLAFSSTVVFGILSCQVITRIHLRQCRWNKFSFASCLT